MRSSKCVVCAPVESADSLMMLRTALAPVPYLSFFAAIMTFAVLLDGKTKRRAFSVDLQRLRRPLRVFFDDTDKRQFFFGSEGYSVQ